MSYLFDDFDLDVQKTTGIIDNEPNSGPHCTYASINCPTTIALCSVHPCTMSPASCGCPTVTCACATVLNCGVISVLPSECVLC